MITLKYTDGTSCSTCVDCGVNAPEQSYVTLSVTGKPSLASGLSTIYAPLAPDYEGEDFILVNGQKVGEVGQMDFTCLAQGQDPDMIALAAIVKDQCDVDIEIPTVCLDESKTESVSFTVFSAYFNGCTVGRRRYQDNQLKYKYTPPRCQYSIFLSAPVNPYITETWLEGPAGGSPYYAAKDQKRDFSSCLEHPQECAFKDMYGLWSGGTDSPTIIRANIPIDRAVIEDIYDVVTPIPYTEGGGDINVNCCDQPGYQLIPANYCSCNPSICGGYCPACPCYGCVNPDGSCVGDSAYCPDPDTGICVKCPEVPPTDDGGEAAAAQAVFF